VPLSKGSTTLNGYSGSRSLARIAWFYIGMKYLTLLSLLIISTLCQADDFEDFKSASTVIVSRLQAKGIHRVGDFDIDQLAIQISATRWSYLPVGFMAGSGEERSTSIYLKAKPQVVVSANGLQNANKSMYPLLALHECLGANGYPDENYQLALSLDALASPPISARPIYEKLIQNSTVRNLKDKTYQIKAGGTSVGGGGDDTALEFKARLLQMAPTAAEQILSLDVEPSWDTDDMMKPPVISQVSGHTRIVISSVTWFYYSQMGSSGENFKTAMVRETLKQLNIETP